jgi:hypothetical protein
VIKGQARCTRIFAIRLPPQGALECEQQVRQMNAVCSAVSEWVQRAPHKVGPMIDGTGHQPDTSEIPEEAIMFKTISAALLAVSVLAAPAFAATARSAQAPVTRSTAATKPAATTANTSVKNTDARIGKHHHNYARHHRHHTRYAAKRTHHAKLSLKHTVRPATKRG